MTGRWAGNLGGLTVGFVAHLVAQMAGCVWLMCAEHVWPVSVEAIDGKSALLAPGSYRLCLTATNLTLVPLCTPAQPEIVIPVSNDLLLPVSVTIASWRLSYL